MLSSEGKGPPRQLRSGRGVNLTPRTVNVLKAHRKRQLEAAGCGSGSLYEDRTLIFATNVGTPLNPENLVRRSFKPLLAQAGLPRDPLPRPQAHVRYAAPRPRRPP